MMVKTAMVLAAGRGSRLAPLTDELPKPLVRVAGATLIDHHLDRLAAAGFQRAVINLHHLAAVLRAHLEARSDSGLELVLTEETELLETAGGIQAALPLLGDGPFAVVNGDVFTDYDFTGLRTAPIDAIAHFVMVPAPPWVAKGDFHLDPARADARGRLRLGQNARFTYAGIGVYTPDFFAGRRAGPGPLRPLMDTAIAAGRLTAELHTGVWEDIGTLERLEAARARFGA